MSCIYEKLSKNQESNKESPSASTSSWTDPKETTSKTCKALSSQFAMEKFDYNDRHQERFLMSWDEWKIEDNEFID